MEVELLSALSRRVRMREISQDEAKEIINRFQTHLDQDFYFPIPLTSVHYQLARNWIAQFNTSLRTLDALHLACASYNKILLVTADEALGTVDKTRFLREMKRFSRIKQQECSMI